MTQTNSDILLLDIETYTNVANVWGFYEQTPVSIEQHWYILCMAYKWERDSKSSCLSLPEFEGDERAMLAVVWELLNAADVVVGHNVDKFDIRKINNRLLFHGMKPPSPYRTVDTLKLARKHFHFNQNGLDPLCQYLGLGGKTKHQGWDLWERCARSLEDDAAWRKMVRYAKQDVQLLHKLYDVLAPWDPKAIQVPRAGHHCPKCGSDKLQARGLSHTPTMTYQRWHCTKCGRWSRSRQAEKMERPQVV